MTTAFSADGTLQSYVVPAGITSLLVTLTGGQGGGGFGGGGASVQGRLAVTPGETLRILVGQRGLNTGGGGSGYGALGGDSGGPHPGGEGGGQSIIFQGGLGRANQRAVAGGGGGQGGLTNGVIGLGGNAGVTVGGAGSGGTSAAGGGPGSTALASGGTASGSGAPGNGGVDSGGRGGTGAGVYGSGGGGGGGYYGGAGGAASTTGAGIGGGGGGGSSYTGGLTSATSLGVFTGPGYVLIDIPNQTPYAPTLNAPANAATIDRGISQTFSWTFADPVAGDSQSAYEFRVAAVGSGMFTSTGKVVTTDQFRTFTAGSLTAGSFEWQVRTYDSSDVVGPWSPSSTFTAADLPATPSITGPVSPVTAPAQVVTWTAPSQTSYQVRRTDGGSVVYEDSGEVVSTGLRSHAVTFDTTGRTEHVQVRIKSSGLWSAWADAIVSVQFIPPPVALALPTPDDDTASISVAIINPAPSPIQPAAVSNAVWVRAPGYGPIRLAVDVPANGTWIHRTPASGVEYEYQVIAYSADGASSTSAWAYLPTGRYDFSSFDEVAFS